MTNLSPEKRPDINEVIDKIEKFGDDNYKQQAIFGSYINIVK